MIELPQSISQLKLIGYSICGKCIKKTSFIPDKQLRIYGEYREYSKQLIGKIIDNVIFTRGLTQIKCDKIILTFGNDVKLKYIETSKASPVILPFVIEFDDASSLIATAELYGAIWFLHEDDIYHPYFGAQL